MRAVMLGNMDIEIYLSKEELRLLKEGRSDGTTVMPMKLQANLQDFHHIGVDDSVQVNYEKFGEFCGGIEVKHQAGALLYSVSVNDRAFSIIERDGWCGSSYGLSHKIKVSSQKCPWPEKMGSKNDSEDHIGEGTVGMG